MTKQTKFLISVVLSCTMLLLLFIPSFAISVDTLSYTPTFANDDSHRYSFPASFQPGVYEYREYPCEGTITYSDGTYALRYLSLSSIPIEDGSIVSFSCAYDNGGGGEWSTDFFINVYDSNMTFVSSISNVDSYSLNITSINFDNDLAYVLANNSPPLSYSPELEDEPIYDRNPFTDIMNMVIEALDVPLFGSFSLWDMITTLCGLFAVIWLLKLLAGG